MTLARERITALIDGLLAIFERKNVVIYSELLRVRHLVRNVYADEAYVDAIVRTWSSNAAVREMCVARDPRIANGTPYESLAQWVWRDLASSNRDAVWTRIAAIVLDDAEK